MQVLAASRYDYHPTIMGQFPLDRHLSCVLDNPKGRTTNDTIFTTTNDTIFTTTNNMKQFACAYKLNKIITFAKRE